jgi:hypothetical protein
MHDKCKGRKITPLVTRHSSLFQASGLVLRRPVMRSPSFHWPRFLSNSVRSKRLSTFRLPPNVAAARRLRCCDIISKKPLKFVEPFTRPHPLPKKADAAYTITASQKPMVILTPFLHPIPNRPFSVHWMFDVRCWLLDVPLSFEIQRRKRSEYLGFNNVHPSRIFN